MVVKTADLLFLLFVGKQSKPMKLTLVFIRDIQLQ